MQPVTGPDGGAAAGDSGGAQPEAGGPAAAGEAGAAETGGGGGGSGGGSDAGSPAETGAPFAPAPHLPWPSIPNHGGYMLSPLRIVTVIAEDEPYAAQLQAFGDSIPASPWYASFAAEYGLTGTPTHMLITGAHVASGTSFTQAQMQQYIADTIAAAPSAAAPDGKTVYVLYLPPGTTMVTSSGAADTGCTRVPYHTAYDAVGDGMALMNRCPGSFPSQLDMFTTVAAHEIAEAATDSSPTKSPAWEMWVGSAAAPWQSSVWNQVEMENSAEIGDLCIFTHVAYGGASFQRVFSNAAAALGGDPCVPAIPVPYFSVTPDPATGGWFSAAAGSTVHVALTGWSSAPTTDWLAWADSGRASDGTRFPSALASATMQTVGAETYPTTNNGAPLSLTVTIPAGATSGWYGAVEVWSWHAEASGSYVPGEDYGHEAVVGFYVP